MQEKANANELNLTCNGAITLDLSGNETITPCPNNAIKSITLKHVIGQPKIKGENPYLFDGTDKYQCKDCLKTQTDSEAQVPFVDMPLSVQQLIDNFLDEKRVPKITGKVDNDAIRIQSRFYYAVMCDLLSNAIVSTNLNLTSTITTEARAANYDADFYEVTPQRTGSKESAALHLLKHMLDLGEKTDGNTWTPGITPGEHNQAELRTILGQPEFRFTNPSGIEPRQVNNVVKDIFYPNGLDTLTPKAKSFLQTGLNTLETMNNGFQGLALVGVNNFGYKDVINPFNQVKTVFFSGKIVTSFFMNKDPNKNHKARIQAIMSPANITAYLNAAKVFYGEGGRGYKLDKEQKNARLDFVIASCNNLLSSPHLGSQAPVVQQWNL